MNNDMIYRIVIVLVSSLDIPFLIKKIGNKKWPLILLMKHFRGGISFVTLDASEKFIICIWTKIHSSMAWGKTTVKPLI